MIIDIKAIVELKGAGSQCVDVIRNLDIYSHPEDRLEAAADRMAKAIEDFEKSQRR